MNGGSGGLVYGVLADLLGLGHGLLVLFVIAGQLLAMAGWAMGWAWTRWRKWRLAHLSVIAFVTVIDGIGFLCPLTTLEWELRRMAGEADDYGEGSEQIGFIEHWLGELLYYDWPGWVFTSLYMGFVAVVALTYWFYPPKKANKQTGGK